MISTLIGIPIGILCSLIAWWIVFHAIVPKIEFSKWISKTRDEARTGVATYRIKFKNAGRRDIVDVQLFARVYIDGLNRRTPENRKVVTLSLGLSHWPTLDVNGTAKLTRLLPEKTVFSELYYSDEIREKARDETLSLEDILGMGTAAKMHIVAFAYDAFSGTRKVFVSQYYTTKDIVEGYYAKTGSLEIITDNAWPDPKSGAL